MAGVLETLTIPRASAGFSSSPVTSSSISRLASRWNTVVKLPDSRGLKTSSGSGSFRSKKLGLRGGSIVCEAQETAVKEPSSQAVRRTTNYHPSIWGDYFLSRAAQFQEATDASMEERHKELENEVRMMLAAAAKNPSQSHLLNLIDQIQRFGVAYRFESEIDEALEKLYNNGDDHDDDLHTLALRFRLLRQNGHNISCDVFTKLTDNEGNFKESLASDVQGMLSLFEATHLRVKGEKILDKAQDFTANHLLAMITSLDKGLALQVDHALCNPIRKSLTRVEARRNISFYQHHNMCHDKRLLEFAKVDFNILQNMHQRELINIMRWWKDLDFANKLPFGRERIVELYFWALAVYFEPQYWLGRKMLTKILYLTSYIDDIYDSFGTYDELRLFTDAIQRWDLSAIDHLPNYMKECYRAVLDVFSEMEEDLAKRGQHYRISYVKAAMKKQVESYFAEAKWPHEGYIPTMEEYMEEAIISAGYWMLTVISYAGMDQEFVSKEVFDWVSAFPLIVRAASVVNRLTDDIVGIEFEDRGIPSAIQCYMKQYGTSKQETCAIFKEQVSNAWKDMNQECLHPTAVAMSLLERPVNFARFIDLIYRDKDGYTNSNTTTKDLITSILVDHIQV